MKQILVEIDHERSRQDKKWGIQNHCPEFWLTILMEEVGEAARSALGIRFSNGIQDAYALYRKELIHVAAVAVAMIESYDRNGE